MALTRGDRLNKATVSSIQSRMGVVSAYEGSGIASAAKSVSGVLDNEAQRRAVVEEEKWKTDFRLKTRETLNIQARANFDNPSGFTNYTNSYIKKLKQDAPTRFKSYAEEYASNIAFTHGERIYGVRQTKDKLELGTNIIKDANNVIYTAIEDLNDSNLEDHQDIYATKIIPNLAEIMQSYENFYNSLTGSEQSVLQTGNPEQYNQALLLGLETERLKINVKQGFMAAALQDKVDLQMGIRQDPDRLSATDAYIKKIEEEQSEYIINPNYNEENGLEVYMNTDLSEREIIIKGVKEYAQTLIANNKKTNDKFNQIIEMDKNNNANSAAEAIQNYNFEIFTFDSEGNEKPVVSFNNIEDVTAYGNNNDFNDTQIKLLENNWIVADAIRTLSQDVVGELDGPMGSQFKMSTSNVNAKVKGIASKLQLSGYSGDTLTPADIKQKLVDYNLFLVMEEYIPETKGFKNPANLDLTAALVGEDGAIVRNNLSTVIANFSKNMGYIPKQLDDMFANVKSLQLGDMDEGNFTIQDRENLKAIADLTGTISNLSNIDLSAFSADSLNNIPLLIELDKTLKKNISISTSNLTTEELKEAKEKGAKMEQFIIKEFISKVNPEAVKYDEIRDQIKIVEDLNKDEQGYSIYNFSKRKLEDVQENDTGNMLGLRDQGIITGVKMFNVMSLDRVGKEGRAGGLEPEFQFAMQEFQPIMERLLVQHFYNKDISSINAVSLQEAMNDLFPYALFSLQKQNYGYDEKGLHNLFGY